MTDDPRAVPPVEPADPPRVCLVVSRYNRSITDRLLEGALAAWRDRFPGVPEPDAVDAPGTFELAAVASAAIDSGLYNGVAALGCVIRGETDHDRYISQAVANALALLPGQTGIPVAFGVVTANTPEQAEARAGGSKGNKGAEAMEALLDAVAAMTHLLRAGESGEPSSFRLDRLSTDKAGGR